MVTKGFGWVAKPKRPTFTCTQDFVEFAQLFPRSLITDAVAFAKRNGEKPVPQEHALSGSRQIDVLFWNPNTRAWIDIAHRNPFYKKRLPGYSTSEVFRVIVTALAVAVENRLHASSTDE